MFLTYREVVDATTKRLRNVANYATTAKGMKRGVRRRVKSSTSSTHHSTIAPMSLLRRCGERQAVTAPKPLKEGLPCIAARRHP